MKKIQSKIYRYKDFKVHLIDGYIQITPVIEYRDKILIMDSGCRSDSALILEYIRKVMKRPLRDIKLAIASHVHPDHAGGVSFFYKYFDFPVAAPKGINLWYGGFMGAIQHKIDIYLGHFVAFAKKYKFKFLYYPRKVRYDYELLDGMEIPFFEDWKVFSCKGHTTHDIVFYNENEKILYAADVFLRVKNRFYLPIPVTFPCLIKKSIEFIHNLRPKHIFLAHGGYMDGNLFDEAHKRLIKQAEMIENGAMDGRLIQVVTRISPEMKKYNKVC